MASRGRGQFDPDAYAYGTDNTWRAEQRKKAAAEKAEMMRKIGDYTVEDVVEIHKTMLEQDKLLERLTKAGIVYSRVIDFDGDFPVIGGQGGATKVEAPEKFPVSIGDWVIVSEETKQITEASSRPILGELVTISRVVDWQRAEVGSITGSRLLRIPPGGIAAPGEEWLAAENVLIHKIERPAVQERDDYTPVYWYEIGGLAAVKQELQESITLLQGNHWDASNRFRVSQPKGILLYGPPGNGKTMLARAVATELSGGTQQFIYVKGPEILSKFVGMSEEIIRRLFLRAREGHSRTGYPSVIFIDEADAIMNVRGSGRSSDVERTIVPAFLTEMDGLEQSHAFVMLATNRPDTLDPAVIREGRIDKHVLVGEPDRDAVKAIFSHHLSSLPCDTFFEELAEAATDGIFNTQGLSGAMCVAVIERTKRLAMRRALQGSVYNTTICLADINEAVAGAKERSI